MPKIAILSDIHGNLPAFQSVLRDVDKCSADIIVFGGDIVGYGASPSECVKLVRALGGDSVFGNHESYTKLVMDQGVENLGEGWKENPVMAGVVHACDTLSDEDLAWLWALPWFIPLNEKTIISHAGLDDPNNWPYIECQESAAPSIGILEKRGLQTAFFGHIHRLAIYPKPEVTDFERVFKLRDDEVYAITVGSVGQSRDADDRRASWVLWDPDEQTVEFKKTEYDNQLAARQIIEAGLPEKSARRLIQLKACIDADL